MRKETKETEESQKEQNKMKRKEKTGETSSHFQLQDKRQATSQAENDVDRGGDTLSAVMRDRSAQKQTQRTETMRKKH